MNEHWDNSDRLGDPSFVPFFERLILTNQSWRVPTLAVRPRHGTRGMRDPVTQDTRSSSRSCTQNRHFHSRVHYRSPDCFFRIQSVITARSLPETLLEHFEIHEKKNYTIYQNVPILAENFFILCRHRGKAKTYQVAIICYEKVAHRSGVIIKKVCPFINQKQISKLARRTRKTYTF